MANWIYADVAVTIGGSFCQPYNRMPGCGFPPLVVVSASAVMPFPTLIAAVATLEACVFADGKGGGLVVNPVNVHCAMVKPHTGEGPGGVLFTVSVSLALFPVSRLLINKWLDVLLYVPATGTVTLTLIVHVPFAAIVPLEKESEPAPAVGVKVGDPQPVVDALVGFATTIAPGFAGVVGSVSVKFRPLTDTGVGLVNVKVRVEIPLTVVGSGLKFFAIVIAEGSKMYA